jgi:CheY-like chemotaxis protein
VRADKGQLEQVLVNLVVNARDAIREGGNIRVVTANVEVGPGTQVPEAQVPVAPGRYVNLRVSDDGCGMSSTVMAHLFEPFFTTKEQGKGTGLGLATVYGIVKQSGGYIFFDSQPNQGTTASIYLPQAQPEEIARSIPTAERKQQATANPGRGFILVVDDNQSVLKLTGESLRLLGNQVIEAASGHQALAAAEANEIDCLVTDVVMPEIDGIELARRLRTRMEGVGVLFMTGHPGDNPVPAGELVLSKPFSPDDLARLLGEALGRRGTEKKAA